MATWTEDKIARVREGIGHYDVATAERTVRQQPPQPLTQAIVRDGPDGATTRLAARSASLRTIACSRSWLS